VISKFYNRHQKGRSYNLGDEVMLSSRNICMRKALKKLADKFLGPFQVIAMRGKNAYELALSKSYGRIHSTFHVALLKPYQRHKGVELPEAVEIEGEEEWEVERILNTRVTHKKRMFLVRWKGYIRDNDS
jgi:hypothetical protein